MLSGPSLEDNSQRLAAVQGNAHQPLWIPDRCVVNERTGPVFAAAAAGCNHPLQLAKVFRLSRMNLDTLSHHDRPLVNRLNRKIISTLLTPQLDAITIVQTGLGWGYRHDLSEVR